MKLRVVSVVCAILIASPALAVPLFTSDLDTSTGWTVIGDADTATTCGWDFTTEGIPASPGGSTTGLKMEANIVSGTAQETAAVTDTFTVSGQYVVEFDFWINVNGPFPGGGSGSTEFCGGGVGHDGVSTGRSGASLIIDGEGGSGRDWRMYKNDGEQFVASGQYDVDTNNNSGVDLSGYFPSQSPPAYQQANYVQQTGSTAAGSGGFAWHHMVITVDTDAIGVGITMDPGIANFAVDGLSIGTIDNSNSGTVVSMSGPISLIYADLFSSLSDNPALSYGVIDNLVVTPEPSGLVLLALGGLALLRRR
jgi:hypothetical protein